MPQPDDPRPIRSESLDEVTSAGAAPLADEYHVDLVADLRTSSQITAKPGVAIPGASDVDVESTMQDAEQQAGEQIASSNEAAGK